MKLFELAGSSPPTTFPPAVLPATIVLVSVAAPK